MNTPCRYSMIVDRCFPQVLYLTEHNSCYYCIHAMHGFEMTLHKAYPADKMTVELEELHHAIDDVAWTDDGSTGAPAVVQQPKKIKPEVILCCCKQGWD